MCGRYSLTTEQEALAVALGVEGLVHPVPRYNIAPTQRVPVLLGRDGSGRAGTGRAGTLEAGVQRWGLVPSWAESPSSGVPLINARSETAHRKPSFREPFRRSRCLVPADGFFEWVSGAGGKVPYWIHRPDRVPFTFAGLSDEWRSPEGEILASFTILTTEADETLRPIHHRMPVVIDEDRREEWLDPEASLVGLRAILSEATSAGMVTTEVSTRVNSPANDDPECLVPAEDSGHGGTVEQTSLF
ncbi:MAG: SOS response-associated peptidase [Gemmatimonadales bacterium]|nr:MAG: SOS response-associated peptidase [Gemmatimonadales bacterium]